MRKLQLEGGGGGVKQKKQIVQIGQFFNTQFVIVNLFIKHPTVG